MKQQTNWRRYRVFAVMALILAGLAAVGWLWHGLDPAAPQEQPQLLPTVPLAVATPMGIAGGTPATNTNQTHPSPNQVAICGQGLTKQDQDLARQLMASVNESQIVDELTDHLLRLPQVQAQATGLFVKATRATWNEEAAVLKLDECKDARNKANQSPACLAAQSQVKEKWQSERRVAGLAIAQLVQLAESSQDGATFSLALDACELSRQEALPACQQNLIEKWALAEPDNAQPWMHLLSDAQTHQDQNASFNALHRISIAKFNKKYAGVTAPWLVPSSDSETWGPKDAVLSIHAGRVEMERPYLRAVKGIQGITTLCAKSAMHDTNHAQTCVAAANLLATHSDDVLNVLVGSEVGGRTGWQPERWSAMTAEIKSLIDAFVPLTRTSRKPDALKISGGETCESIRSHTRFLRWTHQMGELEAMKQTVLNSQKPAPR